MESFLPHIVDLNTLKVSEQDNVLEVDKKVENKSNVMKKVMKFISNHKHKIVSMIIVLSFSMIIMLIKTPTESGRNRATEAIFLLLCALPSLIGIKEWIYEDDEMNELEPGYKAGSTRKSIYRMYSMFILIFILWASWYSLSSDILIYTIFLRVWIFVLNIIWLMNSLAITYMNVLLQYIMLLVILMTFLLSIIFMLMFMILSKFVFWLMGCFANAINAQEAIGLMGCFANAINAQEAIEKW
jgi:hypothetical protein